MTEILTGTAGKEKSAVPHSGIRSILQWLEVPAAPHPAEEVPSLRSHLKALHDVEASPQQRADAFGRLYARSMTVISDLVSALGNDLVLPVPRKERRLVRSVVDLLQMLADDTRTLSELPEQRPGASASSALALWRSVEALTQQVLIGHLMASPARPGTWQQLHHTYAAACGLQLENALPAGAKHSLQNMYRSAILLGCAQPASLTPREIVFLSECLARHADQIEALSGVTAAQPDTFLIDPQRDVPAIPSLRKGIVPLAALDGFSCQRLCMRLRSQIAQLEAGTPPAAIDLPDFAGTPGGLGVLRRLVRRWGEPAKRRFQRRRQDHRTLLATGIEGLWRLSRKGESTSVDLSTWMITNASPDGYAVMHVSGNTGAISVGDVVTIRPGSSPDWQICMVRWAASENPEHLELGLQMLAPRAEPAILARRATNHAAEYLQVLILPAIPKLRERQSLVVASGALPREERRKLLLLTEGQNLVVREVDASQVDEQTGSVEILSIETSDDPF